MSSEPNANLSEPGTAANLAAASNDNYNHVTRVEDSQVGPGQERIHSVLKHYQLCVFADRNIVIHGHAFSCSLQHVLRPLLIGCLLLGLCNTIPLEQVIMCKTPPAAIALQAASTAADLQIACRAAITASRGSTEATVSGKQQYLKGRTPCNTPWGQQEEMPMRAVTCLLCPHSRCCQAQEQGPKWCWQQVSISSATDASSTSMLATCRTDLYATA